MQKVDLSQSASCLSLIFPVVKVSLASHIVDETPATLSDSDL